MHILLSQRQEADACRQDGVETLRVQCACLRGANAQRQCERRTHEPDERGGRDERAERHREHFEPPPGHRVARRLGVVPRDTGRSRWVCHSVEASRPICQVRITHISL